MTYVKRTLMGLGSIALLALLMALVVPKARAVVATLVQVVNTTSNPVPNLDTERNARIPYQSSLALPDCVVHGYYCQFNFATVPAGYRLHAQNFSAFLNYNSGATAAPVAGLVTPTGLIGLPGVLGPAPPFVELGIFGVINQPVTAYFNAGSQPQASVFGNLVNSPEVPQEATLSGYLEDCAVTSCPAIQPPAQP